MSARPTTKRQNLATALLMGLLYGTPEQRLERRPFALPKGTPGGPIKPPTFSRGPQKQRAKRGRR